MAWRSLMVKCQPLQIPMTEHDTLDAILAALERMEAILLRIDDSLLTLVDEQEEKPDDLPTSLG